MCLLGIADVSRRQLPQGGIEFEGCTHGSKYSELNLNQYSVVLPCRTICTVCGSPPCPDLNLIHYKTGYLKKVACLGFGAGGRNRTRDPLITSQVLYQLSYTGKKRRIMPMLCAFGKRVRQKIGEAWFCSNLGRG